MYIKMKYYMKGVVLLALTNAWHDPLRWLAVSLTCLCCLLFYHTALQ